MLLLILSLTCIWDPDDSDQQIDLLIQDIQGSTEENFQILLLCDPV